LSIPGFLIGIVSVIGFLASHFYFGRFLWINWITVLFALFGLILSLIGVIKNREHVIGIAGILVCVIAMVSVCLEIVSKVV
jgi:hypothetical protein